MKLKAKITPYSSVVGSSISLTDETGMVVALLIISIPNPALDYKSTAQQVGELVVSALTTSEGESGNG